MTEETPSLGRRGFPHSRMLRRPRCPRSRREAPRPFSCSSTSAVFAALMATLAVHHLGAFGTRAADATDEPPADVVRFAGLSAEEAVKAMSLPPGFRAHVFASEPDVRQPIAFCLDHRGRIWVAEGLTYPKRRGQPPAEERPATDDLSKPTPAQLKDILGGGDRILVFEDSDGDHRFDKRTVFLENVNLVSGLEVGFGGVWIGAAPYLLFVPVSDWDNPRPAGDPRILLDAGIFARTRTRRSTRSPGAPTAGSTAVTAFSARLTLASRVRRRKSGSAPTARSGGTTPSVTSTRFSPKARATPVASTTTSMASSSSRPASSRTSGTSSRAPVTSARAASTSPSTPRKPPAAAPTSPPVPRRI